MFHVALLLLLVLSSPLAAQQGLIRGRQIVAQNDTLPGGAAVDILAASVAGVVFVQAGRNNSGHGNLVVSSSAGPGLDAVSILGNRGEQMLAFHEQAGGVVRLQAGIDATDDGVMSFFDGVNQTIHIDAGNALNMIEILTSAGNPRWSAGLTATGDGLLRLRDSSLVTVDLDGNVDEQMISVQTASSAFRVALGIDTGSDGVLALYDGSINKIRLDGGGNPAITVGSPVTTESVEIGMLGGGEGYVRVHHSGDSNPRGALYADASGDCGVTLLNGSTGTARAQISACGIGGGQAGSGYINLEDSSSRNKLLMGMTSAGAPYISLIEGGSGTTEVSRLQAGSQTAADHFRIWNDTGTLMMQLGVTGSGANSLFGLYTTTGGESVILSADSTDANRGLYLDGALAHGVNRLAVATCVTTTGTGIPSNPCSTCDRFLRTDGTAGATAYVCEAGTWRGL